ncbi:hypothetical protein BCR43DRAFT_519460, partial [Syncephalastrum racemosum]
MVQQRPVHKATVKNVLSGDTVILRGKPRANGPPPERLLALSNVQAPRMGTKDRDDEPFAFEAREFLRKLLVGKEVSFIPEYTVTTTNPPREYGVILFNNENGKARGPEEEHEATLNELRDRQDEAQAESRGQWSKDKDGMRNVKYTFEGDARQFLNKYKGQSLDAVIEQVRDASTFRVLVTLPDKSHQYLNLMLSGVKAPAAKRDNSDAPAEPF